MFYTSENIHLLHMALYLSRPNLHESDKSQDENRVSHDLPQPTRGVIRRMKKAVVDFFAAKRMVHDTPRARSASPVFPANRPSEL